MLFTEEKYIGHLNKKVRTPFGYQTIEYVYKTVPLPTLTVYLENGANIKVATHHTFVVGLKEIPAQDLRVGDYLSVINHLERVIKIEPGEPEVLYDLSLKQGPGGPGRPGGKENYCYFANNIQSHNSGKSITVACYLCWLFTFFKQKNIGIVANRGAQAREFLRNTKDIYSRLPIWMTVGMTEWNKSSIANENEMRILTDVPSSDSFRGFSIHCVVIDECAFINPDSWQDFADSIFPSQSSLAWKKTIIISTAKGLNHFHDIVQRAKASNAKNAADPDNHDGTVLVEVDWREVPRYRSDGSRIPNEEFRNSIISKNGRAYFEQNYGNNFTGSSETLVDPDLLDAMVPQEPQEIQAPGLKVFEGPKEGRVYLMGVDGAKDGADNFAVQVLDITEFPFRQVAAAKLDINYLEMPGHLYEWGAHYNSALMIIENNEGAGQSIADTLVGTYEYPNMHFDEAKKYPGFRTSVKSRPQILKMMQVLLNAKKIEIGDPDTIKELKRFEKINGKYQAAEGHDDMVMSLAVCMAPLINMDNYEDYRLFLKSISSDDPIDTTRFLTDLSAMSFMDF